MKKLILTFIITSALIINISGQEVKGFGSVDYYHAKVMDVNNHLDSWYKDENGPFEFILGLSADWWKKAPFINGWPIWCTAALVDKEYNQDAGAIPGSACSFAILACLKYYVYTGDTSFLYMAKTTGNYIISQDLTLSEFVHYPNFPYAVGTTGNINPQGTGHPFEIDTLNPILNIQPDKGAMLGTALLELYKVTGNLDYLNTSVNIANCLSDNAIVGTATYSPWPMRVMADNGSTVDGVFSANVSYACRLFDELLRIGQDGNGKYEVTRDAVWSWLKAHVIAFDDGSKWCNFFEDHGGDEINSTQINALETVRYLLEKKNQADQDWFNLSEKIINQVTRRWAVSNLENDGYVSIVEQDSDQWTYNSHTARYGSILAMFFEAGANISYKDIAFHSLCFSHYSVENDGYTNTYFMDGGYAWTTDSFGDFLFHYMEAIGAIPEWAGDRNCLLKSTSTITKVSYIDKNHVKYSTFDDSGIDKLKLIQVPLSVKVNGVNIKSYSWNSASNVLVINRLTGKNVEVNLVSIVDEPTVPALPSNIKIWIYPNPTNNYLNLELDQSLSEGSKLEVCDFYGRILFLRNLEEGVKYDLDLPFLNKGVYFIHIQNGNKNYFQKIVIQ